MNQQTSKPPKQIQYKTTPTTPTMWSFMIPTLFFKASNIPQTCQSINLVHGRAPPTDLLRPGAHPQRLQRQAAPRPPKKGQQKKGTPSAIVKLACWQLICCGLLHLWSRRLCIDLHYLSTSYLKTNLVDLKAKLASKPLSASFARQKDQAHTQYTIT